MPFPKELQWKLWRARQHYDEFNRELMEYLRSDLVKTSFAENSTDENKVVEVKSREPVPARFALIAGDFLQNLRSTLDYLVWQLVIANGKTPKRQAFPICTTQDGYEKCHDDRLRGIDAEAKAIIDKFQPYLKPEPDKSVLAVIDEMCNLNKHRTVLMTSLGIIHKPDGVIPVSHVELEVIDRFGTPKGRLIVYVRFEDGVVKGLEVASCLDSLANYVGYEVFPLFEKFFG
jgi:hypothetical protein